MTKVIYGPSDTESIERQDSALTDSQLCDQLGNAAEEIHRLIDRKQRLEYEVIKRLAESGGSELWDEDWQCGLAKPATPQYDVGKLRMEIGKVIPPAVLATGYSPEQLESKTVAARFHLREVNTWPGRFGPGVQDILDKCRLPAQPRGVTIERKEKPEEAADAQL